MARPLALLPLFPLPLAVAALLSLALAFASTSLAQPAYTVVSYNCENLFDTSHDSLRQDHELLPDGARRWTPARYRRKVGDIARAILQCGGEGGKWVLPDLVALAEVENDSVMLRLTRRSPLSTAYYKYVMTTSPDVRGIDVALLYNPYRLRLLQSEEIAIPPARHQRATRNILHATLLTAEHDSLHVFVVHAPSRRSGDGYRLAVAERLLERIDSVRRTTATPHVIVAGDFNDYSHNKSVRKIAVSGLAEASANARGIHHPQSVLGTYYYQREWDSLDHIFVSPSVLPVECYVYDADWLLERGAGGSYKPRRTYLGTHYHGGVSDHLPLVFRFRLRE